MLFKFAPYTWEFRDTYDLNILAWCMNERHETALVIIEGYNMEFKVPLPKTDRSGRAVNWTPGMISSLIEDFYALGVRDVKVTSGTLLYYFQTEETQFLTCKFRSIRDMKFARNKIWNFQDNTNLTVMDDFDQFEILEADISPITKLHVDIGIEDFSGWIEYDRFREREDVADCDYVHVVNYRDLRKSDIKTPISPSILSFDIETHTDDDGRFPNELDANCPITIISATYQDPAGKMSEFGFTIAECDSLPADVHQFTQGEILEREQQMIERFFDLIRHVKPHIITGWNIFGFDLKYINARRARFDHKWERLSRYRLEKTHTWISETANKSKTFRIEKNYPIIPGILLLDGLPIFERTYPGKQSYKLDSIAKEFLNEKKEDMPYSEIFQSFKESRVGKPGSRAKWTQVMSYALTDSRLVIRLFNKTNVFIGLTQLSNIVGISIWDIVARGQQLRCYILMFIHCRKKGIVINKVKFPDSMTKGAMVFDPIKGFHKNVMTFDFASLYPSIMIAFNICHTTLVDTTGLDLVPDGDNTGIVARHLGIPESDVQEFNFLQRDDKGYEKEIARIAREKKALLSKKNKEIILRNKANLAIMKRNERKMKEWEKAQVKKYNAWNRAKAKAEVTGKTGTDEKLEADPSPEFVKDEPPVLEDFILSEDELCSTTGDLLTELTAEEIASIGDNTGQFEERVIEFFVKTKKGIIPSILEDLIQQRRAVKEKLKGKLDPIEALTFSEREKAIKVTSNSFYGALGATEGYIPLPPGSKIITFQGRTLVTSASNFLCNKYDLTRVYGDTDSAMLEPNYPVQNIHKLGHQVAESINGIKAGEVSKITGQVVEKDIPGFFGSDRLQMEFENVKDGIFIAKKMYIAYLVKEDGTHEMEEYKENGQTLYRKKIMKKGVNVARRDTCNFMRVTYTNLMRMCLDRAGFRSSYGMVMSSLENLPNLPLTDLTINKSVGESYVSDSAAMKIFKERMIDDGVPVRTGDRVDYVLIKLPGKVYAGEKFRLLDSLKPNDKIDYDHYIEKIFANPLDKLLTVSYPEEVEELKPFFQWKTSTGRVYKSIDSPVELWKYTHDNLSNSTIAASEIIDESIRLVSELLGEKLSYDEIIAGAQLGNQEFIRKKAGGK